MRYFISLLCILTFQYSVKSQSNGQHFSSNELKLASTKINADKAKEAIDGYLNHLEKIGAPFNGLLYIYNEEGEIFYQTRGYANVEFKVKTDRSTAYNLASVSKLLNALVVLKLSEAGLVDIYAPIKNYIKDLDKTDVGALTIYELLTHTSGLPEPYEQYLWEFVHVEKHNFHPDSLLNHLKDVNIKPEAKGQTDYTNLGPILSAMALERITGKSYKSLLKKYLITPLGLQNTGIAIINDQEEITINKAKTYEYYYGSFYEFPFAKVGLLGAAAGLHASAFDLQKVLNATFFNKTFLSASSLQILTQPYKKGKEYSFGCFDIQFEVATNKSVTVLGHEGYIWGVSTAALFMPRERIGLVLLSNKGFTANLEAGLKDIVALLYGGEVDYPRIRLDNKIMEFHNKEGFNDFVDDLTNLEQIKKAYVVEEYEINELGYYLIGKEHLEEAEAVFELNCRLFSSSSNAYDSLGEVEFLLKDFENSLTHYKKSLALDSSNENAKDYLAKIIKLTNQ